MRFKNLKGNNFGVNVSLPPPASWKIITNTGGTTASPKYVSSNSIQYLPSSGYIFGTYYINPSKHYYGSDLNNLSHIENNLYCGTNAVVFNNWVYRCLNDTGISRTQDGITNENVVSNGSIRSLMSTDSYIIGVGTNGNIQRSTDGVNFTTIISGTTRALMQVFKIDNKVIIGTNNYSILVSTNDGLTFSSEQTLGSRMLSTSGASSNTCRISANLIGQSNPPYVYRTTNGTSYNNINIPHAVNGSVTSMTYHNNKFYVTTYLNPTSAPKLFESSDDGLSFQEISLPDDNIIGHLWLSSANNILFASSQNNGDVWAFF